MTWFECRAAPAGGTPEVFVYGDIGAFGILAKDFIASVKALGKVDSLRLRLNSGGGDVFEGLAIYNFLRAQPARIEVVVDGLAASISSIIAMAGDSIEMPSNAWMMIHDPRGFIVGGRSEEMRKLADTLDGIKKSLVGIYATRTGIDPVDISRMMNDETWMDGELALSNGFATSVTDTPVVTAHIGNLHRFHNVPAAVRALFEGYNDMSDTKVSGEATKVVAAEETPTPVAAKRRERRDIIDSLAAEAAPKQDAQPDSRPQARKETRVEREVEIEREAAKRAQETARQMAAAYRSATRLGFTAEHVDTMIDDGVSWGEVPEILIEAHARRASRQQAVGNLAPSGVSVGFSNEDPHVVKDRIVDALSSQFIPHGKMPDESREYANWRAQDIMMWCLHQRGVDTRGMTRAAIVDQAMHSTSDFPNLLATTANKIFLGSYQAAPATFRTIASQRNLSNFQTFNMLRDGDFPTLSKILETGEYTYGSMSESKETAQLATYGRIFSISRESLVNDTLGVFGSMTAKIGQAVARFENTTVWNVVMANGNMADGVALYAAGHSNLAGSAGAISATTMGAGRSAMRLQKSLDGAVLNVTPRYLVVPAAKETVAEQVLQPLTVVTSAVDVATMSQRSLSIVVEPLLDGTATIGTTAWYLFSDPAFGAAIQYGYLEGDSAPRITTNEPFNQNGISFRVRLDFHAEAVDYRFTYRNNGA